MIAHIAQELDGWWGGVLRPFDGSGALLAVVLVGILAGIGAHVGREPWMASTTFMFALTAGLATGALGFDPSAISVLVIGAAIVAAALLYVDPPRIGNSLPMTALVVGAVVGVRFGVHHDHEVGIRYGMGVVFTTAVVMACTVVAGTTIGRSFAARRAAAVLATIATLGVLVS